MKTNSTTTHLNNGGFSLIELIVVMAIMVAVVAGVFASVTLVDSSYAKEVQRGVEDYVDLTRTKSMSVSAKEWYMTVTVEDDVYATILNKVEEVVVEEGVDPELVTTSVDKESFNSRASVAFDDGAGGKPITEDMPLDIYFSASTGKISKVTVGGAQADLSNGIGRIIITSGDYEVVLKLFYNTGKCEKEE